MTDQDARDLIAIGTTLYIFDHNRRHYDADRRIIYREHFEPVVVIGETPKSWIVSEGWAERKIRKSDLTVDNGRGYGRLRVYTAAGMEENVWEHDNRHRIVEAVRSCDLPTLRAIHALLFDVSPNKDFTP